MTPRFPELAAVQPLVLKLGGELLETAASRARIASACAAVAAQRPLVIVHGGGRAIDVELDRRGIVPRKVDGLRITDAATLDVVVAVLAGNANTDLVASLVAEGVRAVGLTGVDAGIGRARPAAAHRTSTGTVVDLGRVGDPARVDVRLVELLAAHGYVPVLASLGIADDDAGGVLNVNADVMACRLAAALPASDLVIAGATPGVFDADGAPLAALDGDEIDALIASGIATAGMIAKLSSCRQALLDGVSSVRIVDGRAIGTDCEIEEAPGTTLTLVPASSAGHATI